VLTSARALLLFAAWWLLWAAAHAWIVHSSGFSWQLAFADSFMSTVKLAALCFALSYTLRYYRPDETRSLYLLLWVAALAGLWVWVVNFVLSKMFAQDAAYLLFLERSLTIRYCIGFLVTGGFILFYWVWYYVRTRQEDTDRRLQMEKLAREAELVSLRQQLQPHFLFNTLNSISALAGSQPEEARKMIHQLSDFLRGTLKKDDHQTVTLAGELDHLQLYLEIEKVRFGHRLNTFIECNEECRDLLLPSLLLQPIVENAIKFGLYDTTDAVTINITAKAESNFLVVSISNPYDPATAKPRQGTGFGLSSVNRRLSLLFGRNDLLQTVTEDNIFIATIKIPQP
jgi:two-component system LytT family sensor kinase